MNPHTTSFTATRISLIARFVCTIVVAALLAPGAADAQRRQPAGLPSVAELADSLTDAVVNISTTQIAKGPQGVPMPKVPKGSPFEDLFEDFFSKRGEPTPSERKVSSLGSGFVIDGELGLVVTNNHVIDGADEIYANFHDGSKLKVEKVLGTDTKTDLALLKVKIPDNKKIASVPFGSSEDLRVGDWVMAIGNPFGLGGSVTVGIISAKQRDINAGPYDEFLQTDAAINKGNSGGPLFNMNGEVVGVNTAIISPTGGSVGIGFSVPANLVKRISDQLIKEGRVRRAWLGVNVQDADEALVRAYKATGKGGVIITRISDEGPAAKSDMEVGDLVLRFDGQTVTSVRELTRLISDTEIGRTVPIAIVRDGKGRTVNVTLGELEDEADTPAADATLDAPASSNDLGAELTSLDDDIRRRYGIPKDVDGVVVTTVSARGRSFGKLQRGDVLVEVNFERVTTVTDTISKVEAAMTTPRQPLLLRVKRRGEAGWFDQFISVDLTNS